MRAKGQRRACRLGLLLGAALAGWGAAAPPQPALFADKSPAEVYCIVHRSKWAVDVATVFACTSRRTGATPESVYERLMAERSTLARTIAVVQETVHQDLATVIVEGRRLDRGAGQIIVSRGTVTLVKEDGVWRIRHESWSDIRRENVPQAGEYRP